MKDFDDLVADVKEIRRDVKEISITMYRNTTSLEHHMARTEASEKRLEKVESWLIGLLTSILLSVLYHFLKR